MLDCGEGVSIKPAAKEDHSEQECQAAEMNHPRTGMSTSNQANKHQPDRVNRVIPNGGLKVLKPLCLNEPLLDLRLETVRAVSAGSDGEPA